MFRRGLVIPVCTSGLSCWVLSLDSTTEFLCFSWRNTRSRRGERKRRGHDAPLHHPLQKWHNLSPKVKHMILQLGKSKGSSGNVHQQICFSYLTCFFYLTTRTSLDQTTLNQSVSVNGVHSDNDTSQVRLGELYHVMCCTVVAILSCFCSVT